jgi:hypothetical protein
MWKTLEILMSRIVECGRSDSVKIHNPNDQGNPLSVQIPAELLYAADVLFREMCHRGETSPALLVSRTVGGTGGTMWRAEYGGTLAVGVTPWSAMKELARKVETTL